MGKKKGGVVDKKKAGGDSKKGSDGKGKKKKSSKSSGKKAGAGDDVAKAKIDRAASVQKVFRKLRAMVSTTPVHECGKGEAELLHMQDAEQRVPEVDHEAVDGVVFDEKDKSGAIVRTLDNFCVYDASGTPFDLSRLLLDPSLVDGVHLFGTIVAPLRLGGDGAQSLVRVSRSVPRAGDKRTVEDLLEKRLAARRSGNPGSSSSSKSQKAKSNIKLPDFNPSLTREQAWADAAELCASAELPIKIGSMTIHSLGRIISDDDRYHTKLHFYPVGFRSERLYANTNDPHTKIAHFNEILEGPDGPIFQVTLGEGEKVWTGGAPSNVWQAVLNDLNKRRERMGIPRGGDSISGPEMFGFANAKVACLIEGLDGVLECENYLFRAKRPGGARSIGSSAKRAREPERAPKSQPKPKPKPEPTAAQPTGAPSKPMSEKDMATLNEAAQELAKKEEKEATILSSVLDKLASIKVDSATLASTGALGLLNRLRKHPDKSVSKSAKSVRRTLKENGDSVSPDETAKDDAVDAFLQIGALVGFADDEEGADPGFKGRVAEKTELLGHVDDMVKTLGLLERIAWVTEDALISTGIGKHVGKLRKHPNATISTRAGGLKSKWEAQLDNGGDGAQDDEGSAVKRAKVEGGVVDEKERKKEKADDGGGGGDDDDGDDDEEDDDGGDNNNNNNNNNNKGSKSQKDEQGDTNGVVKQEEPSDKESAQAKDQQASESLDGDAELAAALADDDNARRRSSRKSINEEKRKRKLEQIASVVETPVAKRQRLEEAVSLSYVVPDKSFKVLRGMRVDRVAKDLADRPRVRVHIPKITGISMTHGEFDGILWIETPSARYRIAGRNVPVAPAINFSDVFVVMWKRFEACRRFFEIVTTNENDPMLTLDVAFKTIVDGEMVPCPRRVFSDESPKYDMLTRDDVLDSMIFILDQITRGHKRPEKVQAWLASKVVFGLLQKGCRVISPEHREHVKSNRAEEARIARQHAREVQRRDAAQKRMIDEGVGLPDDMEVVAEDREREGTEAIENTYLRAIAEAQLATPRPTPLFFPCDPAFVSFDQLCSYRRPQELLDSDFKSEKVGAFGTAADKDFSRIGLDFSEMLSLWSGLRFLGPLLDEKLFTSGLLDSFAQFRQSFASSQADVAFVALLKFLSEQAQKELKDASTTVSKSAKSGGQILAVEETGIATRRGRRGGRTYQAVYSSPEAVVIPTYPYNADELWPVDPTFVSELSWSEVARRALVFQLQIQEAKGREAEEEEEADDEEEEEAGKEGVGAGGNSAAQWSAIQRAILVRPDLLSTCDEILHTLIEDPAAGAFTDPPDPNVLEGYFDVIKRPMDFSTIQKRLHSGHYNPDKAPETNRYNEFIKWVRPEDLNKEGEKEEEEEEQEEEEEEGEEGEEKEKKEDRQEKEEQGKAKIGDDGEKVDAGEKNASAPVASANGSAKNENSVEEEPKAPPALPVKVEIAESQTGEKPNAEDSTKKTDEGESGNPPGSPSNSSLKSESGPVVVTNERDYKFAMDKRFYDSDCLGGGHAGFAADVRQVFRNARKFNASNSKAYNDCKKLQGIFRKLYEEKVLFRDPTLIFGALPDQVSAEEVNESAVAAERNTLEEIAPFQPGLPALENVVLEMNAGVDFTKLSVESKLRAVSTLLEMAFDSQLVSNMIRDRADNIQMLQKEFAKQERDDAKKTKELSADKEDEQALEAHRSTMQERRKEHEHGLKQNEVRLEPLGTDRFFNRYWFLDSGASPSLFVELARTGEWGVFENGGAIEKLIASLDRRGARENELHRNVTNAWNLCKDAVAKAQESTRSKVERYTRLVHQLASGEQGEVDADDPHLASLQADLKAANEELEKATEEASIFREASAPNGQIYYFHRETRAAFWEMPPELKNKERIEESVNKIKESIQQATSSPETALESLKGELVGDLALEQALAVAAEHPPLEKQLDSKEIASCAADKLESMTRSGFRHRQANFFAMLLAIEFVSAAPDSYPTRAANKHTWLGDGSSNTPRRKWVARVEEAAKLDPHAEKEGQESLYAQGKALMIELYEQFIGNYYQMTEREGQVATLSAIKHKYRWTRAVQQAKSISELALLLLQFCKILDFKSKDYNKMHNRRLLVLEDELAH